jgi:hypothetical protein
MCLLALAVDGEATISKRHPQVPIRTGSVSSLPANPALDWNSLSRRATISEKMR